MRTSTALVLWTLLLVSCTRKTDYENRIDLFRSRTIGFYVNPEQTPLDSVELKSFKGIQYFPINESMKIQAALMWLPQSLPIMMPQTGGDVLPFTKVAIVSFSVNGKSYSLQAYQSQEQLAKHQLFIPFADATNGKLTYAGGRYLDVVYNPAASQVELDFNFAYAPFCAYTKHYSCPVVPKENSLDLSIEAGERN